MKSPTFEYFFLQTKNFIWINLILPSLCLACSILPFSLVVAFYQTVFITFSSLSLKVWIILLLVMTPRITACITVLLKSNDLVFSPLLRQNKDHHNLFLPSLDLHAFVLYMNLSCMLTCKQNYIVYNVYLNVLTSFYILVDFHPLSGSSFDLRTPLQSSSFCEFYEFLFTWDCLISLLFFFKLNGDIINI